MSVKSGVAVIKVSGGLLSSPTATYLGALRETVLELISSGLRLGIVTGGGRLAREHIQALRSLRVSEAILDLVGIEAARLNALSVAAALAPYAVPRVPTSLEEALSDFTRGLIPVMGGLQPGQSTNAVAAVLAETIGADTIVNLLNGIDGVYDRDPKKPGARRLERLTYSELDEIVSSKDSYAGTYELFDKVAIEVVKRSSIRVVFIDGKNPKNIIRALKGEGLGSIVGP